MHRGIKDFMQSENLDRALRKNSMYCGRKEDIPRECGLEKSSQFCIVSSGFFLSIF